MKAARFSTKIAVGFCGIVLIVCAFAATSASAQPSYTIKDLGTLGGTSSIANGINISGQVVGNSLTVPGSKNFHAYLYSGGIMHDLGTLGGANSGAYGINDAGVVVGAADISGPGFHVFLYSGGIMQDLGTLGGTSATAYGINNSGQVVGGSDITGDTGVHAFLYSGTIMQDLGTFGGTNSQANGINDAGVVVGQADVTGLGLVSHAFLYSGGTMQDLGTLGGTNSAAYGINKSGQLVGKADITGDTASHAYLYSGGIMHDLGTLGGTNSTAYGINNSGKVVGQAEITGDTASHAFLYDGTTVYDLNNLIPSSSGWLLNTARTINDSGQIAGTGTINGEEHTFLLNPRLIRPVTTGTNVAVLLSPQIALTFSNVASDGSVTAITISSSDLPTPPNFSILGGTSYDITTDASFNGLAEVCIGYNPDQITVSEQQLRLLHYSSGAWTDITLLPVDTANKMVCGQTSSLSVFAVAQPTYIPVTIDIEPWFKPNIIDIKFKWAPIPVAILSTPNFDAPKMIDQASLTFGHTGDEKSLSFCSPLSLDVNADGARDLICFFYTGKTGFQCGDAVGTLKGKTKYGTPIVGSDSVKIVPCK